MSLQCDLVSGFNLTHKRLTKGGVKDIGIDTLTKARGLADLACLALSPVGTDNHLFVGACIIHWIPVKMVILVP